MQIRNLFQFESRQASSSYHFVNLSQFANIFDEERLMKLVFMLEGPLNFRIRTTHNYL